MSINTTKQDEEQKDTKKLRVIFRLFKYMLQYKKQIIIVVSCMLLNIAIAAINPLLIDYAIDEKIAGKDIKGLIIVVAISLTICTIYMFLDR